MPSFLVIGNAAMMNLNENFNSTSKEELLKIVAAQQQAIGSLIAANQSLTADQTKNEQRIHELELQVKALEKNQSRTKKPRKIYTEITPEQNIPPTNIENIASIQILPQVPSQTFLTKPASPKQKLPSFQELIQGQSIICEELLQLTNVLSGQDFEDNAYIKAITDIANYPSFNTVDNLLNETHQLIRSHNTDWFKNNPICDTLRNIVKLLQRLISEISNNNSNNNPSIPSSSAMFSQTLPAQRRRQEAPANTAPVASVFKAPQNTTKLPSRTIQDTSVARDQTPYK